MRYKCLIFDHDDTTVNSTRTVHYPSFLAYMKDVRPELKMTLDDYVRYNFYPGVIPFFRDICGLSDKEMVEEQNFWMDFSRNHVSDSFPGIREIMVKHKEKGGIIGVISHSFKDNILRDYEHNKLPMPDAIYGWEEPREERKPSPVPVYKIMEKYNLKPEEILMIDDLKPGLDMSKAAGIKFAAAGWCFDIPENEKYMRENADFYFKSVEELRAHIED